MQAHSEEAPEMAAEAEAMAADAEELTLSANREDAKPEKVDTIMWEGMIQCCSHYMSL